MVAAHIDYETRSPTDLPKLGLHRYARDPLTSPWCMSWAIDNMEPELWVPGMDYPKKLRAHVEAGGPVYAHNAPFELEIQNVICVPRYGFPVLHPEQAFCTMAMCYSMGLPGALEDAAPALGMTMLKDGMGRAIMLRAARPWQTEPLRWLDECPELTIAGDKMTGKQAIERLKAYCQQDVRVERELHTRVMPLSATERRVWLLDYKINQRGVQVDIETAKAAVALGEKMKERYDLEMAEATNGAATTCSALAPIKTWLAEHGLPEAESGLAKQEVVDFLARDDISPEARRVLSIRQEAGKVSNAKFDVMVNCAGDDGRLRQMYQYHGAATGRWAGRKVQPHNLVRDMPPAQVVEQVLELARAGQHDAIDAIFGPPLSMTSRCLRSFFIAPRGRKLVGGDFANIEGRGQAWFAGEQWKLNAFVAADNKTGPGIYEMAVNRMFGIPVDQVKNPSEERQWGKVSEVAFGYQGGVGSFHAMGRNYGVTVPDAKADGFKVAWRAAHPKIVKTWYEIQRAAIAAVENPGEKYSCGYPGRQATFRVAGSFLWLLLPSGRVICYPYPKVLEGEFGPQLTYMTNPSADQIKKGKIIADPQNSARWKRISTYGGTLFNNIIQGFCRDLLAGLLLRLDDAGADIVLHTHDDGNLEVDDAKAEGARAAMEQMMRVAPAWATGLPLHAKCAVMQRWGK